MSRSIFDVKVPGNSGQPEYKFVLDDTFWQSVFTKKSGYKFTDAFIVLFDGDSTERVAENEIKAQTSFTTIEDFKNEYDNKEELIKAVAKRRRKVKTLAIEYKGGKCQICGYKKYQGALDLHHITGGKEFGIADKGYTRSWEKVKTELDKCILVCANCHRELEAGITQLSRVSGIEKRGEFGEALNPKR